ncbi:hypothetical protein, partial [Dialister succinatiphilus]|uniref:hypothetical protein n=1 Tax=Dialister succinatiphilus TaxID=487173 RepID=UPI003F7F151C
AHVVKGKDPAGINPLIFPLPNILYEGSKGSEGGGGGFAASFIKKGRGWRRGLCRRVVKGKVLRIDGPFRAQGFLSLTALRAEGCGIALAVHSEHILKER